MLHLIFVICVECPFIYPNMLVVVLFKAVIDKVEADDKLFKLFLFSFILIFIPVISMLGGGSPPPPPPKRALKTLPTPRSKIRPARVAAVPVAIPATLAISTCWIISFAIFDISCFNKYYIFS